MLKLVRTMVVTFFAILIMYPPLAISKPPGREDVANMQKCLNMLGYQVGKVDGIQGNKTKSATRHFEKSLLATDAVGATKRSYSALLLRCFSEVAIRAGKKENEQFFTSRELIERYSGNTLYIDLSPTKQWILYLSPLKFENGVKPVSKLYGFQINKNNSTNKKYIPKYYGYWSIDSGFSSGSVAPLCLHITATKKASCYKIKREGRPRLVKDIMYRTNGKKLMNRRRLSTSEQTVLGRLVSVPRGDPLGIQRLYVKNSNKKKNKQRAILAIGEALLKNSRKKGSSGGAEQCTYGRDAYGNCTSSDMRRYPTN